MSISSGDNLQNRAIGTYASNVDNVKYFKTITEVQETLEHDIKGCDAKFTLFVSAVGSIDREQLRDLIPPMFIKSDNKCDFHGLLETINATPKLNVLLQKIKDSKFSGCNPRIIHLLHYLLCEKKIPTIRSMTADEDDKVFSLIQNFEGTVIPTDIFEIYYKHDSEEEKTFDAQVLKYGREIGLCGISLDKYYSVLYNGFLDQEEMKRNPNASLHLTKNILMSLQESSIQSSWEGSSLGTDLKCIALCQYICRSEYFRHVRISNCLGVSILLGDIVRPRYLMFFAETPESLSSTTDMSMSNNLKTVPSISTQVEFKPIPQTSTNCEQKYLVLGMSGVMLAIGMYAYKKNCLGFKGIFDSNMERAINKCSDVFK
ncbi:protein mono-ADP-ribosyltransferase Parp16-like [Teleopsis dalmanni]|uniref:protein mono-ADP-ribosyltransferase Parp16-like n=1 Tax=Teleopsis dalmanni TaxID=139649 RepID=UPI0018CF86F0|nr:protein mono-ADP-ribosyltransferase Parp16-like [Teleopsis dalmanni]